MLVNLKTNGGVEGESRTCEACFREEGNVSPSQKFCFRKVSILITLRSKLFDFFALHFFIKTFWPWEPINFNFLLFSYLPTRFLPPPLTSSVCTPLSSSFCFATLPPIPSLVSLPLHFYSPFSSLFVPSTLRQHSLSSLVFSSLSLSWFSFSLCRAPLPSGNRAGSSNWVKNLQNWEPTRHSLPLHPHLYLDWLYVHMNLTLTLPKILTTHWYEWVIIS